MEDHSALLDCTIDALAHLIAGRDSRNGVKWPKANILAFDGFEILAPQFLDYGDDELLIGAPNDAPIWPMDAVWALPYSPSQDYAEISGCGWLFKRVRTLKPAEWRGKIRMTTPKMYEKHESYVDQSGGSFSSVMPYGVVGGRLVDVFAYNHHNARAINPGQIHGGHEGIPENENFDICSAHGIELRREYNWSVLLGEEGIPRARFVTDCIGVREAFRLRHVPPGKDRRAALRHWVRQHWRQKRTEAEPDKTWVRAHMRGAVDFRWNGLSCRVEPSREDIRRSALKRA